MNGREGPNKQGGWKKFQNLIHWGQNKGGVGILEKALNDYKRTERPKQVVINNKTKIYAEACYFAMIIGRK